MPYWQLYYHIVTATRDREPLLTSGVKLEIFQLMKEKCYDLGGTLYALNGIEDHVHMVAAIPPKIAVATFVGQIKGYSSSQYNQNHPYASSFLWQAEYGAFTFDKKRLSNLVEYVVKQVEHHHNGQLIPILEKMSETDGQRIAEETGEYLGETLYDLE